MLPALDGLPHLLRQPYGGKRLLNEAGQPLAGESPPVRCRRSSTTRARRDQPATRHLGSCHAQSEWQGDNDRRVFRVQHMRGFAGKLIGILPQTFQRKPEKTNPRPAPFNRKLSKQLRRPQRRASNAVLISFPRLHTGCRQLDQRLQEIRRLARATARMPHPLPCFMRLPVVTVIEQIDAEQVFG